MVNGKSLITNKNDDFSEETSNKFVNLSTKNSEFE